MQFFYTKYNMQHFHNLYIFSCIRFSMYELLKINDIHDRRNLFTLKPQILVVIE
jgi:hypothetical protein